jgi:hypothetical protein
MAIYPKRFRPKKFCKIGPRLKGGSGDHRLAELAKTVLLASLKMQGPYSENRS